MTLQYDFVSDPSVAEFQVPVQTFLIDKRKSQPDLRYECLACGAVVLDNQPNPRILLVQRAAHDSMPNLWECPGGACDDEDASVLHSVARELWEESGLTAKSIGPRLGDDHIFPVRSGKLVCRYNFLVKIKKAEDGAMPEVKLDPNEHQNYVWATEEDVRAQRSGAIELRITTKTQEALLLEAFKTAKVKKDTHARDLS